MLCQNVFRITSTIFSQFDQDQIALKTEHFGEMLVASVYFFDAVTLVTW